MRGLMRGSMGPRMGLKRGCGGMQSAGVLPLDVLAGSVRCPSDSSSSASSSSASSGASTRDRRGCGGSPGETFAAFSFRRAALAGVRAALLWLGLEDEAERTRSRT